MEKLRQLVREREGTIHTQILEIDAHIVENNFLKSEVTRIQNESIQYKDTLKRMYLVYLDQQKWIQQIQSSNAELAVKIDFQSDKNNTLFNDVQNMTLDKELIETRLKEGDKKYHFDVQSLASQMNDKNLELSELRRKVNDLIEIKRRLEEETAALRFSLDSNKNRLEGQLREKQVRIEQLERTYNENNLLKNDEILHYKNKIKEQDLIIERNQGNSRQYLNEINALTRELAEKNNDITKMKLTFKSAGYDFNGKENNNSMNKGVRFDESVQNDGGNNGPDGKNRGDQEGSQYSGQQASQQQQQQEGKHQKKSSISGLKGDNEPKDEMEKVIELTEISTRKRCLKMFLEMWKTKFALSTKNRKGGLTVQDEKKRQEAEKASESQLSTGLASNLIEIVAYIRKSSVDILFELYQRSIDASESKKINSLIIFTINLRELKVQFKGVNIILEMYNRQIIIIKKFLEELKRLRPSDGLIPTITIATGKLWSKENDHRDQANKWIESTLNQAIEQKMKTSKEEKNRDIIFLFRLLTLKHKVKYPLQGAPYNVDYDLLAALEHKICDAFRRTVVNEF